jgi:hypothetical protein
MEFLLHSIREDYTSPGISMKGERGCLIKLAENTFGRLGA